MRTKKLCFFLASSIFAASIMAQTNTSARPPSDLYHNLAEKKMPEITDIVPGLKLGLLVEVEAEYVRQDNKDTTDLKLATMEFGIDFKPLDWAKGHILFLWEEGNTEPVDLDEATITLGNTEETPLSLTAGRQYLPFGVFNTHFISDPLIQTLAEIRATAVMAGYENDFLTASIGAFRGKQDDQEKVNNSVGALSLRPFEGIEFGVYAISDIGESDTFRDNIIKDCENYDKAPGLGGYLSLEAWLLHLDAEYISATKAFEAGVFNDNEELKPHAWNLELTARLIERLDLTARLEGGKDLLPAVERQFGGAVNFGIVENLTITFEYLHTQFEDDTDDADALRCRLAARF